MTVQLLPLLPSRLTQALGSRCFLVTRLLCIHVYCGPLTRSPPSGDVSSMGFRAIALGRIDPPVLR